MEQAREEGRPAYLARAVRPPERSERDRKLALAGVARAPLELAVQAHPMAVPVTVLAARRAAAIPSRRNRRRS